MRRRTWIAVGVTTLGLVLFSYVPKLWSSARGFRGKMLVEQAGRWSRSSVNPPAILLVTAGALLAGATLLAVRQRRRNGKADALLARSGSAATAARRAGLSQDAVRMMWKVRSTTPAARGVEAARPTGPTGGLFRGHVGRRRPGEHEVSKGTGVERAADPTMFYGTALAPPPVEACRRERRRDVPARN